MHFHGGYVHTDGGSQDIERSSSFDRGCGEEEREDGERKAHMETVGGSNNLGICSGVGCGENEQLTCSRFTAL